MSKQPLFEIKSLKRYFPAKGGKTVKAVDDVTFDIFPGETFSLVGESGCGKPPAAVPFWVSIPKPPAPSSMKGRRRRKCPKPSCVSSAAGTR